MCVCVCVCVRVRVRVCVCAQDLGHLEQIWELNQEWECAWDSWKVGQFMQMDTESMGLQAQGMLKRVVKLGREVKVSQTAGCGGSSLGEEGSSVEEYLVCVVLLQDKGWSICDTLKQKIDTFKRTMPLIQDLRNPAMRARHWDQLKEEVQRPFDEASKEFTLELIIELGLEQYSEAIGDISAAASKELAIENALNTIATAWETTELDIGPYKDKGHFRFKYVCVSVCV